MPRARLPLLTRLPVASLLAVAITAFAAVAIAPAQAQTFTVLHEFKYGPADGQAPIYGSLILDAQGNLYGVTSLGGDGPCSGGCGTLFKLTPQHKLTVLYSFGENANDGRYPYGSLIQDAAGNFYGTTYGGGTSGENACYGYGCGTVYTLSAAGKETVLYNFSGGADGASPTAGLARDAAGNVYGTTQVGGAYGWGTVFKVDPSGNETVLNSFDGDDGGNLLQGVILDSAGNLYGETFGGGLQSCTFGFGDIGCGVIYEMTTTGKETILYHFSAGSANGFNPEGEYVLLDSSGNIYATDSGAGRGSPSGLGNIFMLDTAGNFTVLHAFTGGLGGLGSVASLIADPLGNLYGTSDFGGGTACNQGCGIVFELATDGTFTTLHSFTGGADGRNPWGLVMDGSGNLYGTTLAGGVGNGTVYEITP